MLTLVYDETERGSGPEIINYSVRSVTSEVSLSIPLKFRSVAQHSGSVEWVSCGFEERAERDVGSSFC